MLETESADAVREWNEWRWFHDENNWRVIQQLDKRKHDRKLRLHVDVIQETQNNLAAFLAVDGAHNRTRMVVFRRPFGRVREIWHLDMGLGLATGNFDLIEEEDYLEIQQQEIEVEQVGDWLLNDEGSANIGNPQ
ncbi:hypothetical protein POM88_030042 [Heracleum sosnowskyi]|uniref:Uncharacterized protein n=1 Tax=Heracleum sosnowskyi TaxID=360622 RepID=A0AAD8MIB8_9APIA|nr:hypothetical protein POM88_030042 [Heracleum sosnowskyi]